MSDAEDFATLFARESARPVLEVGQIVKGRVIQISAESVGVGDEVEATVVSTGDEIRLSHKLRQGAQARQALAMAAQTGIPVEGKVAAVIKGVYEVTVGGLRGFCPFSQMDLRRAESGGEYVGRVLEFRVMTFSENGRNLVLSRRKILEERAAEAAEETRKKILPGAVLAGTVASLADFGAFIDLGGVQGLVPLSELSHSRVSRPADLLRIGDAVTVKVLAIDEAKGKISLSLKALAGDPWVDVARALRERQIVNGRVARMTDFGVFVELLPGVDGLLHLTEIPRSRHGEMKQAAESGAPLVVLVTSIDPSKRRIGL